MERVVVVGGGVLGTMHALAARLRGFRVTHLEREPAPRVSRLPREGCRSGWRMAGGGGRAWWCPGDYRYLAG